MIENHSLTMEMKSALRRLAKAVVVITAHHDGQRFAMAATAVSELSLDPPSMLVCVNKTASIHYALEQGASFGINILHKDHQEISVMCGGKGKGEERFSVGKWLTSSSGVPYLEDAQASFICINDKSMVYGTHSIFIGRVVEVMHSGDVEPLIYADGQYKRLSVGN